MCIMPRRAIPGIGFKMNRDLRDMGVAAVADVAALPRPALLQKFGDRSGHFLYLACRGKVVCPTPPQTLHAASVHPLDPIAGVSLDVRRRWHIPVQ